MQLFTFVSCSEVSFLVRVRGGAAQTLQCTILIENNRAQHGNVCREMEKEAEESRLPSNRDAAMSALITRTSSSVCLQRCCTRIVPVWMSLCLQLRTTADAGEEGEHYRDPRQNNPAPRAIQYPVQNYAETVT